MLYTKKNTKQTFIKPLQAASAFWSRGFLQIVCSSSCWGTHHGPFDAQLHVAVTPALGVSMSQVLGLCMAFWKPNSDYVLLLTISVFNAEYIIWYNMRLESYLKKCNVRIMKCLHSFICYQSIILETNSRQNCFASSKLPSLWCQVEGNKHVLHIHRSTACLLSTLSHGSLRNITTARRKNQMHWMHWTRT